MASYFVIIVCYYLLVIFSYYLLSYDRYLCRIVGYVLTLMLFSDAISHI